jgi:hypothetical protein
MDNKQMNSKQMDNISICKQYLHEIRNLRSLNDEMINNISSFNDNDKMIMIKGLNDVLEHMIEIIFTLIE